MITNLTVMTRKVRHQMAIERGERLEKVENKKNLKEQQKELRQSK